MHAHGHSAYTLCELHVLHVFQCICVCMMYVFQCICEFICMYCMYRVCMSRLAKFAAKSTYNMHNICTRYAQDIKANTYNTYTYIHIWIEISKYGCFMCMYAVCIAWSYIHIQHSLPNTYIRNIACICIYGLYLHVYACICMYVPVYAWLPAATNDAGTSSGNTTGWQHHGLMETVRVGQVSAVHIPFQMRSRWVLFIQSAAPAIETPWRGTAPLDQLRWGLRRDRRMHTVQGPGGPIGGTRNSD